MYIKLHVSLFFLLLFGPLSAQHFSDTLEHKLQIMAIEGDLPGFAVAIVNTDGVLYQKGFGYADLKSQKPYTEHTVQNIGSISKTLIGIALMKAVEEGKLRLDDPINDILPFTVVNPYFPEVPIRVRHLATHTSGITDTKHYEKSYLPETQIPIDQAALLKAYRPLIKQYNRNVSMPMADFLKRIVSQGGSWYKKRNFLKKEPGTTYEYSNVGASLLAYIIEIATGENYQSYTRKHILEPIGMSESGWNFSEVKQENFITHYVPHHVALPKYTLITYPDGGFIASVHDLAKYLRAMMQGYQGNSELLSAASFQEMMSRQSVDIPDGLCWDLSFEGFIGHSGSDPGTCTLMYFHPESNTGMILLINISPETEALETQFMDIWNLLIAYARKY